MVCFVVFMCWVLCGSVWYIYNNSYLILVYYKSKGFLCISYFISYTSNSLYPILAIMGIFFFIYPMWDAHSMAVLCFVVVKLLDFRGLTIKTQWPIFFRIASLALRQSCDCLSASEVILKNMGHCASQTTFMYMGKLIMQKGSNYHWVY